MAPKHLLGASLAQLQTILATLDQPSYRVTQILHWIYQRNVVDPARMSNLPAQLRDALVRELPHALPRIVERRSSEDGTLKLRFELHDGASVESVLMPGDPGPTLCLSTQTGCRFGCRFCATGGLGFGRHLTAWEILAQVSTAWSEVERPSRLVFMGMGEPLDNLDELVPALAVLTAPEAYAYGGRRITVATIGLPQDIRRLGEVAPNGLRLTLSLNAPNESLRGELMPGTRAYPLDDVMAALRDWNSGRQGAITIAYVLLAGVNDSVEQAAELIGLLHGIRAKVNLIPFNEYPGSPFSCPTDATIDAFAGRLARSRIPVTVRRSKGARIAAACGQLVGKRQGEARASD